MSVFPLLQTFKRRVWWGGKVPEMKTLKGEDQYHAWVCILGNFRESPWIQWVSISRGFLQQKEEINIMPGCPANSPGFPGHSGRRILRRDGSTVSPQSCHNSHQSHFHPYHRHPRHHSQIWDVIPINLILSILIIDLRFWGEATEVLHKVVIRKLQDYLEKFPKWKIVKKNQCVHGRYIIIRRSGAPVRVVKVKYRE